MKKCPNCDKTFEDSMKFCQVDGTLLVDDEPAFDPYATIVGGGFAVPDVATEPAKTEPEANSTSGSIPIEPPADVLDLGADPLKTMYVSDEEMKAALNRIGTPATEPEVVELEPIETTPDPEPPSFTVPDVPSPSFSDPAPPPSPYSGGSPYSDPLPAPPAFDEPRKPQFDEAATILQSEPVRSTSPFDPPPPAAPPVEWTPPSAPDASWQNQEIGSNTPFQPPPAGVAGENKTLAIVSLVLGILGLTVCCGSFIVSIAALVLGFMARSKANQNPQEYGGAGLATAGIVTGALGVVGSIIFIIFYFVVGIASLGVQ